MTDMLIATADAFGKNATYIARGQVVSAAEVDWKKGDPGFIEAPPGVTGNAVVEISAIAPTGPNPRNPQQIAPGTVQTAAGYVQDGAVLVGEVTLPAKQRIVIKDDTQAKVTEALADADAKAADAPRKPANK